MKYGRIERERKFLLNGLPALPPGAGRSEITDTYIAGTRLRLREMRSPDATVSFKFTFKDRLSADQHWINSFAINANEAALLRSRLDGHTLLKTRWRWSSGAGLADCVDVFSGALDGLVVLEVEAETDALLNAYQPPCPIVREITGDAAYCGDRLAAEGRPDSS